LIRNSYIVKLNIIRNLSKCNNNCPFEDIKITTNCIFRSGTLDGGTIFDGWTNVKQKKAWEVSSGNSQTNNVLGKGQDLAKTLITKTASIICLLS